jgi:hypothetical protein
MSAGLSADLGRKCGCPSYRGCWPQRNGGKEIEAENFLQKSKEVTGIDSIRSYPLE